MEKADALWLGAAGALSIAELIACRKGKGQLTMTVRRALFLHTKAGRVAFSIGWPVLASRIAKHLERGGW